MQSENFLHKIYGELIYVIDLFFFVYPNGGVQYVPTRSQWLWAVGSDYTISIKLCRNSLRANGFRLVNHASPRADYSLKRNPR